MEKFPNEKRLQTTSLIMRATRGVIRDQNTRRKAMFILVLGALVLLFFGTTFLQSALNPRQHPVWFILFWLLCAWLTLTATLLAIFDLLVVRLEALKAQRQPRKSFGESTSDR
jgi:uncharacterized membrane protein YfcA